MNRKTARDWMANLRLPKAGPSFIVLVAIGLMAQTAFYVKIRLNNACTIQTGSGTPEASITGSVCDLYLRTNGSTATTLYVKESGTATNTGWAAAGSGAGGGGTVVRKTADESVTSSTTLQNDDHLTVAITASQVLAIRFVLFVDAGATGDLKLGLSVPAAGTYRCGAGSVSNDTASTIGVQATSTTTVTVGGLGASTVYEYELDCTVVNSTTAGNVVLQWAQATSDGTATTLKANSLAIVGSPAAVSVSAAGGLALIEQHTASASADLTFTTCITSTYDEYRISLVNIVPASAAKLQFFLSTDGGATYDTSSIYDYAIIFAFPGTDGSDSAAVNASGWSLRSVNTTLGTNGSWNVNFTLYDPGGALYKVIEGPVIVYDNSVGVLALRGTGIYKSTTPVNAFQVKASTGNLTSGTGRCYGVAK